MSISSDSAPVFMLRYVLNLLRLTLLVLVLCLTCLLFYMA